VDFKTIEAVVHGRESVGVYKGSEWRYVETSLK